MKMATEIKSRIASVPSGPGPKPSTNVKINDGKPVQSSSGGCC